MRSGHQPRQADGGQKTNGNQLRQELAAVIYKRNVLGSRGARKMKVIVPKVDKVGNRKVLRPLASKDTMLERYKRERQKMSRCAPPQGLSMSP